MAFILYHRVHLGMRGHTGGSKGSPALLTLVYFNPRVSFGAFHFAHLLNVTEEVRGAQRVADLDPNAVAAVWHAMSRAMCVVAVSWRCSSRRFCPRSTPNTQDVKCWSKKGGMAKIHARGMSCMPVPMVILVVSILLSILILMLLFPNNNVLLFVSVKNKLKTNSFL